MNHHTKMIRDWDLYKNIITKDPFYIFDIVTENKIPHIKEEAIRHLNGLKSFENQLRDFREKGKFESMYFTVSVESNLIQIGFLESKQTLDLFKDNKLLGYPGFDCYAAFHNDTYHRICLTITPMDCCAKENSH